MIGRHIEQEELLRRYSRNKAEFIAVYGRRRVGKTTLISETFKGKFTFQHAGLSPAEKNHQGAMAAQLQHFHYSLKDYGLKEGGTPGNWLEAFYLLEQLLKEKDDGARQIVFLDEMPWMDTPRSGFITALEGFWNNWGCHRKNLMLIVCGSASSWIQNQLINNHGGLYGRVTCEIRLSPFTLCECEQFFEENHVRFSRYDIVQSYMIFGGIPFYLDALDERLSLAQNIDRLFFEKRARFSDEYDRLFASVFGSPESMKAIVNVLYKRKSGYTRKELSAVNGLPTGGALTAGLKALEVSDFIEKYVPFGKGKRETRYRLIDPFCLFYLHFVSGMQMKDEHYWTHNQTSQPIISWRGLAFENVCFFHIPQIKAALGISSVRSSQSPWIIHGEEKNAQIDLMIERDDHVVNACEIKYYSTALAVDKQYYQDLLGRQELLTSMISPKSSVYQTIISTYGLKKNEYSGIFTQSVTMEDLFRF